MVDNKKKKFEELTHEDYEKFTYEEKMAFIDEFTKKHTIKRNPPSDETIMRYHKMRLENGDKEF